MVKQAKKKKKRNIPQLTLKQKNFLHEYVKDFDGNAAAIRAGYADKFANAAAYIVKNKPHAKAYLDKLIKEKRERQCIGADRVLNEYAIVAFSNIRDFMKEGFNFEDLLQLEREKCAAIESVKVSRTVLKTNDDGSMVLNETVTFKLHSKIAALDALGRHLGIFEKDNKQKPDQMPVPIVGVMSLEAIRQAEILQSQEIQETAIAKTG